MKKIGKSSRRAQLVLPDVFTGVGRGRPALLEGGLAAAGLEEALEEGVGEGRGGEVTLMEREPMDTLRLPEPLFMRMVDSMEAASLAQNWLFSSLSFAVIPFVEHKKPKILGYIPKNQTKDER